MRSRAFRGFTLIELLVVLAIITLVLALLLPALSQARESARALACSNKMRQIGVALHQYINDHGVVPREASPAHHAERELSWAFVFRPYFTGINNAYVSTPSGGGRWVYGSLTNGANSEDQFASVDIYRCPSYGISPHNIHYANNGLNFAAPGEIDPEHRRQKACRLSMIRRPSRMIYLSEFTRDESGVLARRIYRPGASDFLVSVNYDLWLPQHLGLGENGHHSLIDPRRHLGSSNTMYVDGHVRSVPAETVTDLSNWDDQKYGATQSGR